MLKNKYRSHNISYLIYGLFFSLVIGIIIGGFFVSVPTGFAQGSEIIETTDQALEVTPLGKEDPRVIVARIIQIFLGFLGAVALVLIIYAGYLYMTSGGDNTKVEKAKKIIINAVIGLAIIMLSFAIVTFILNQLSKALGIGQGGTQYEYYPPGLGSGSLGRVIQDHFPGNNAVVPRNTVILVTFIEPIWPVSVIKSDTISCFDQDNKNICTGGDCKIGEIRPNENMICRGQLDIQAMKVYRACDSVYAPGVVLPEDYSEANRNTPNICNDWTGDPPTDDLLVGGDDNLEITITPDFKTIVFNPYGLSEDEHLGSALFDTGYLVQLTNNIINLNRNAGVFSNETSRSYTWQFTTDTTLDLTPPFVTGVYPVELDANGQPINPSDNVANNGYPRNTRVRVDFSEPVIPPIYTKFSAGAIAGYENAEILVYYGDTMIEGQLLTGINNYRSVVFKSLSPCGADVPQFNSCGDLLTCLPALETIVGQVNSVPVENLINGNGPTASIFPAGGIVDAALNALDTNGRLGIADGITSGRAGDNFVWRFKTSNEVDLSAPLVVSKTPSIEGEVLVNALVTATFTKSLDPSTTINKNMGIISDSWDGWYTGSLLCPEQIGADGSKFCFTNDKVAQINHSNFSPAKEGEVPLFYPLITSGVQDMMGNCFNPGGEAGSEFNPLDPNPKGYCNGQEMDQGQSCCAIYNGDGAGQMEIVNQETCPY